MISFLPAKSPSFWMSTTAVAFRPTSNSAIWGMDGFCVAMNSSGVVVATHTMAPLDERLGQYPSVSPAQYAIEVNAGVWDDVGLQTGERIEIPASLLKRTP